MICVDCGKESPLIDGSCPACFAKQHDLLIIPDVVDVELCAHCRARHVGAHWHDVDPDIPEEWVLEETMRDAVRVHQAVEAPVVDVAMAPQDTQTFGVTVEMEGAIDDVPVQVQAEGLLRRRKGVCDRCSRIQGGFYAAIIQLRGTERDLTEQELEDAHDIVATDLDHQLGAGNRFAFLSKSGGMHGGYDYYIGDIEAARNVARRLKDRFGGTVVESPKLVGRREGEDVYRVTFLLRLPRFAAGDIVVREERPFLVLHAHGRGLLAFDLEHQRQGRIPEQGLRRLGGSELVEAAVVVSQQRGEAQVLDPSSQRTETVLVDPAADVGETVGVVRVDERLYWVPGPGWTNKS